MQFDAVPQELRALRQWCVWRAIETTDADGRPIVKKPPRRSDAPGVPASPTEPATWGSFEDAVQAVRNSGGALSGIGFMLTPDDPYVVWDIDEPRRVPAHMVRDREELQRRILALGTYTEVSPSGNGLHAWVRGHLNVANRNLDKVGMQVYYHSQFITVTGVVLAPGGVAGAGTGAGGPVVDGAALLHEVGLGDKRPDGPLRDDYSKPLDLADEEVVRRALAYGGSFPDRWHAVSGYMPTEWSHSFFAVVGTLDKVTGSVEQIQRVVMSAPMVRAAHVPPAGNGEHRSSKAIRIFARTLADARTSGRALAGDGTGYGSAHGGSVYAAICEARERAAEAERERVAAEAEAVAAQLREVAEAAEAASREHSTINLRESSSAAEVLARFAPLGGDATRLRLPPGIAGEFVAASLRASPKPYLKYAIPAALSVLAGVTARSYAPDRGGPLNMNFILLAASATGKTVSMDVWEDFLAEAAAQVPMAAGKPVSRIVKNGTASIPGIWPVFQDAPSCVWFIEEASSQFNSMSRGTSPADENLRNFYNELYDSGKHGKVSSPPRSVANRNAGIEPINKLCVSTYWTTTPEKFAISDSDVRDGFASRVVFIHHDAAGGEMVENFDRRLPTHLRQRLTDMLAKASWTDRAYDASQDVALEQQITICTREVQASWWALAQLCDRINREAIEGKVPKAYQMLSRVPMNARRLACILAVADNPWAPAVTGEQLVWAHNYLMHNAIAMLAAMDSGEVGDNVSDEVRAAIRLWKEMLRKGAGKGTPGIPRSKLLSYLGSHTPFRSHRKGRTQAASETIDIMIRNQIFEETLVPAPGRGKPQSFLMLREA